MKVLIRQFTQADLAAVKFIEETCFKRGAYPEEVLRSYGLLCHDTFLVAEHAGRVVGYALGEVRSKKAVLISLAVLPEFRRQGIGSKLWQELRQRMQAKGVKVVRLHVRVSNEAAIKFYERHGFKKLRVERNYYANGEDAWLMQLEF